MGAFANLGALAGGASGWNEGSKRAEEKKQYALDQKREERLSKVKHERTMSRDAQLNTFDKENAATGHTQALELQGVKDESTTSEREAGEDFTAGESVLDREGRTDVARINQEGQNKRSSQAAGKWAWSKRRESTINPDGSMSEKEVNVIKDPDSQLQYVQKGDVFRLDGEETPIRYPKEKQRWEKDLADNVSFERGRLFYNTFHYLPASFFHDMKAKGMTTDEGSKQ